MNQTQIWNVLKGFNYWVIVDILCVAWLIYRLLLLAKGTRALQIIYGLTIFFIVVFLSDRLHLYALHWLLRQAFPLGPVAIVILFLPELRHALEEFGRPGFWGRSLALGRSEEMMRMVDAVVGAVCTLSVKRLGALIVFEREMGLEDIAATGTHLDATASSALLGTIFYKGTPLHDGAVIIRQDRIAAAGCTLPLTASPKVDGTVHTRHKAALGISEQSDAVVVVVSEETGTISIAVEGRLIRGFREDTLRERLVELLKIGETRGRLGPLPIGQMATRVGDALKTAREARRSTGGS
jgi:diadenylate cyclase